MAKKKTMKTKKFILASIFVMLMVMSLVPLIRADINDIKIVSYTFSSFSGNPGSSQHVHVTIKNTNTQSVAAIYLEAGIARKGWDGYSMFQENDFFSFFNNLFSAYNDQQCCPGNEFYDGGTWALNPGEQITVTLNLKAPTSSSYDHCNDQGSAWNGYGANYVFGVNGCNNCYGQYDHRCTLTDWSRTFTMTGDNQCKKTGQSCTQNGVQSTCCSGLICQNFGCYPAGNECNSGETASCTITNGVGTKTCSSSNNWGACIATSCNSGYTLNSNTCVSNPNPDNETGGSTVSLTEDAYNEATPTMILNAMCQLPVDCSKTKIFNIDESLTAENYSVTCRYSTTIVQNNKNAIQKNLEDNGISGYVFEKLCTHPEWYTVLIKSLFIPANIGVGAYCESLVGHPENFGTCRATQKSSSISYCQFTSWASLKIIDKNDKCKDGLYTILIGFVFLIFVLPMLKPK